MKTKIQVLSDQEMNRVHESSLQLLASTGVRVETALGRQFLAKAGAQVNETTRKVYFPRDLVEYCLKLAPRTFTLGARRSGWDLKMNGGQCYLVADGEAPSVLDYRQSEYRRATFVDWLRVTRLLDTLDEVGVYWTMVEGGPGDASQHDLVRYWRYLFSNFSKHVQDAIDQKDSAPWLIEVLQVVFGDRETIRTTHPYSFLICPQSPLIIDRQYTDAYLALAGLDIPVAIMPMPLMGGTAPGTMISNVIQGNCEVLSMLCLIQAAAPGTPIIYAPALAIMDPRTGLYSAGKIENAILGVAAIEMGRYYGLPVEGTGGGTDQFIPGIQAGYERAMSALLPVLSWPDLLVGPGLMGGSTVMSLEQLIIDVEVFRMSQHAARGIETPEEGWLENVIDQVGPGGHYLAAPSTLRAMRGGEWYHPQIGHHGSFEAWVKSGRPGLLRQAHNRVQTLLAGHDPLPLPAETERELRRLELASKEL